MSAALLTRHSPSRCLRNIGHYTVILRERQQQGEIAGVYPLVVGDRCYFVAVDSDGPGWQEDAAATRAAGSPVAVERSRSGNGAHAWFFFSAAVSASAARQMASYLLTEAMSLRAEIGIRSYDRIFPNQDTLPRGGFGTLIALLLQWGARRDCGRRLATSSSSTEA